MLDLKELNFPKIQVRQIKEAQGPVSGPIELLARTLYLL